MNGCELRDDGDGVRIESWNDPRPQPSQAELDAAILLVEKSAKMDELKRICTQYINSGFISSALGSAYTYDSALPQDQINLLGAKLSGVDVNYTCTNSTGTKAQVMHTAAQISQVFADGATWVETNKAHFYTRADAVQAAATVTDVQAVVW